MPPILEQLIDFFTADGWAFEQISDLPALRTQYNGENGAWTCYAHAREPMRQFVFYSVLPVKVPANKLDAVSEFITRANYGMIVGNFEMNHEDGEVRYKTSIDTGDADLSAPIIRQLVYPNVTTMDAYLPGLMAIIYSNASPAAAIARVEGPSRE